MKKLKGIKFKNTDGNRPNLLAGQPMGDYNYGYGYIYDENPPLDRYGNSISIFDGPHSQSDCKYGEVYKPSPTAVACGGIGQSKCPAGRCVEPQSQADCPAGFKFYKKQTCPPNARCARQFNKCVKDIDDYGYESEPKDLKPKDVTAPPVKTMGFGGSNWLLPALLIGAGIFILTRKSE